MAQALHDNDDAETDCFFHPNASNLTLHFSASYSHSHEHLFRYNLTGARLLVLKVTLLSSCGVGALSSLIAIALIVVSRTYRHFIHRLFLYISIAALLLAFCYVADAIEWSRYIAHSDSKPSVCYVKILLDYLILVLAILNCWVGIYFVSLALCGVDLKRPSLEVAGIITTVLLPALASGLMSLVFIHFKPDQTYLSIIKVYLFVCVLPFLFSTMLTALSFVSLVIYLCRGAFEVEGADFQNPHRKAIKEASVLLVFSVIELIVGAIVFAFYLYYYLAVYSGKCVIYFPFLEFVMLIPSSFTCLPVLLLCQPLVRRRLGCGNRLARAHSRERLLRDSSSHTYYSVPKQSGCTDQEPLYITQK